MNSIKKIRLSDQIIDKIKKMIDEENFVSGDKFYSENELTGKLDVSRSSIREAVRILEATGYVKVKHGKGIFITEPASGEDDSFRKWLISNSGAIFDQYEARLIIESAAASYAAERACAAEIGKLEEICSDFNEALEADNRSGMIVADEEFHLCLAGISGNKTLFFLMKTMTDTLPDGWISSIHIPSRAAATAKEHGRIFEAIKAGSSELACKAMIEHLQNAVEDTRSFYDGKD